MRKWFLAVTIAVLSLGVTGCMMDASKLAKYSNPKLHVSYNRNGVEFEAGSDFKGDGKVHVNPVTKEIDAEVHVDSSVSAVDKAEGERADHLVELRRIEAQYLVESQRIVGENIKALGSILGDATGFIKTLKPAPKGLSGSLTQFGESVGEVATSATKFGNSLVGLVGDVLLVGLLVGGLYIGGRYLAGKMSKTAPPIAPTPAPSSGTQPAQPETPTAESK